MTDHAPHLSAIESAVRVEMHALEQLGGMGRCVFVYACTDCGVLYRATVMPRCDAARICISHGRCDVCDEDAELADLAAREGR